MAVYRITANQPWQMEFDRDCWIEFASASPVGGQVADFQVYFNDELVDRVHINVPHSWWKNAGQQICDVNPMIGDVMRIESNVDVDLRLDIRP